MMAGKQKAKKSSSKDLNPIKSAILLRLAMGSSSRVELVAELKEQGHDPKALSQTLNDLVKGGLVRMDGGKGKCSLRQDFPTFKAIFGLCAADGKETEFLATAYSKSVLSNNLFPILTKEFVHSAILSTLLLLTMPPVDRAKNSSLLLLHKTVFSDPYSSTAMQGIAGSLEAIGFPEALKKALIGLKTKQERDSETYSRLEKLAEDYLSRFLGSKTPLPSALEGCQSLLFPEKERAEILEIIRSSPFALTFLLANEDKSQGTVMSIATPLLLPALEHMFTLFALFKLFSTKEVEAYIEDKKKRADKEFMEVVERRKAGMQQPSHLLLALRSCRLADMP
jgi:hypothetical protein